MHILVLNSGSSSIKFQLLNMPSGDLIASGLVERLGTNATRVAFKASAATYEQYCELASHKEGLGEIAKFLKDPKNNILAAGEEIKAVGHRVVHGGSTYSGTVAVNPDVKKIIKELGSLAPLHNPNNLLGIEVAEQLFPNAIQVAVFDTAFHQAIPDKAKRYAIPDILYEKHGIQVYGFHGTSHQYVAREAERYLGTPIGRMITIHLGNGCSMTAIKEGQSLDHSLGFGPSNGLIMGTRSGDIDHALIFYLVKEAGYTPEEILKELPSLNLEKIYATITYYLHNRSQLDFYLLQLINHRKEKYQEFVKNPSPLIQRLKAEKIKRTQITAK